MRELEGRGDITVRVKKGDVKLYARVRCECLLILSGNAARDTMIPCYMPF